MTLKFGVGTLYLRRVACGDCPVPKAAETLLQEVKGCETRVAERRPLKCKCRASPAPVGKSVSLSLEVKRKQVHLHNRSHLKP